MKSNEIQEHILRDNNLLISIIIAIRTGYDNSHELTGILTFVINYILLNSYLFRLCCISSGTIMVTI
jgi:hypothetical protein